ncbi:MAG: hypothetical protein HC866_07190 [Leptolyngbyaceae cyanobacterium RU_5_1]|nr:hypothetical protein [Leptolyngbyaceae cyanobacterium RU_5_1]
MTVYAAIELTSGTDLALIRAGKLPENQIRTLHIKAIVDPQISMLLVPEFVKHQLGLQLAAVQSTEITEGWWMQAEIYRYMQVQFENRRAIADVYVIPNQTDVVIGRSLMQAMDVLVDPQ